MEGIVAIYRIYMHSLQHPLQCCGAYTYMHGPEGVKCPEGQVHVYQPEHEEGVL